MVTLNRSLRAALIVALVAAGVLVSTEPALAVSDTVSIVSVVPVVGNPAALTVTYSNTLGSGGPNAVYFAYATIASPAQANYTSFNTAPVTYGAGQIYTIVGRAGNTSYPVTIAGWNGTTRVAVSSTVTATTVAAAPGTVTATTSTTTSATVTFSAPIGGTALTISNYQYSLNNGATWTALATADGTSPITIPGLVANTAYTQMKIRPVTSAGAGAASATFTSTTLAAAPTGITASAVIGTATTPGNGSALSVAFTAPTGGGAVLTGYQFRTSSTGTWRTAIGTSSPILLNTTLTGNTRYTKLYIRAINAGGSGTSSSVFTGITSPPSPSNPIATAVVGDSTKLSIRFTAATGGAYTSITNYAFTLDGGAHWVTLSPADATTPVIISGLSGAAVYTQLQIRAVTSIGSGSASVAFTGTTVASTPSITAITGASTTSMSVAFTAPAAGTPTNYQYSTDGGSTWLTRQSGTTTSPLVITTTSASGGTIALAANSSYSVKIRAVSAAGNGDASATVTGATLAAAPTAAAATAVAGDATRLTMSFTAPAGAVVITGYEFSVDNGASWTAASGSASPVTIAGLSGNTAYVVQLRAVTSAGSGVATAGSSGTTVPDEPSGITVGAVGQDSSRLTVAFTAPAGSGSTITAYQFSLNAGSTWTGASGTTSPITITALTGNTAYTQIRVRAVSGVGIGATSSTNLSGTTVPGTPTGVSASPYAGDSTRLNLTYTAPTGGAALSLSYDVSIDGGASFTYSGLTGSPLPVTGLASNHTFTSIQLRASSTVGHGPAGGSVSGTTQAPAPTVTAITAPSTTSLSVAFNVAGGDATSGYKYSVDGGATWKARTDGATTTSPMLVTQLSSSGSSLATNTAYAVQVLAVNIGGDGIACASTNGTTLPGAPSSLTTNAVSLDGTRLSVTFTAPTGSAAVTNYEFSTNGGSSWTAVSPADGTSPVQLQGLTGNTAYTQLQLRAVNASGVGTASSNASGTTVATAPAITGAVGLSTTSVSVAYTAPSGGSANTVSNYQYSTDGGTTWATRSPSSNASPLTIGGLGAGTIYPVQLRAVTSAGLGSPTPSANATTLASGPVITAVTATAQQQLSVAFNPVGGATTYDYTSDGGVTWKTRTDGGTTASPIVVTEPSATAVALSPHTTYTIQLRAIVGGTPGSSGAPVQQTTLAAAPTSVVASGVAGDSGKLAVAYVLSGSATVASVQYSLDGGSTWQTATGTASPVTIAGLNPNTAHTALKLRAINAGGTGAASVAVTGTTVAAAATAVTVSGTSKSVLSVSFTPPAAATGITTYQFSTDGGSTWKTRTSGTISSPLSIDQTSAAGTTPLTAGTLYTVQLRALTGAGTGVASNATAGSTFASAPTAMAQTDATNGSLQISFTAPNPSTGVTTYQYSTDGGSSWKTRTTGTTASPIVINETSAAGSAVLTSNTAYAVQLRAITIGGGSGDGASATGTTKALAPTGLTAAGTTADVTALLVTFTQDQGGGAVISKYEYDVNGSGVYLDALSTVSPVLLQFGTNGADDLNPNSTYTVRIRAVNAAGAGATSTGAIGATAAQVPTNLVVSGATSSSLNVAFSAPAGSATTTYDYSVDGGSNWTTRTPNSTATSFTITGLLAGSVHVVRVRARNASGSGIATAGVAGTTLAAAPTGPSAAPVVGSSGTLGDAAQLVVSFTPPAGTAAITSYQFTTNGSTWTTAVGAGSPITLTGLTGNTRYTALQIRAVNASGPGTASVTMSGTTAPAAPTSPVATGVASQPNKLSVAFNAVNGGAATAIVNYEYSLDAGVTWAAVAPITAGTPIVLTGLTAGTTNSQLRIRSVTATGAGTATATFTGTTVLAAPSIAGISSDAASTLWIEFIAPTAGTLTTLQYSTDDGATWLTRTDGGSVFTPLLVGATSTSSGGTALTGNTNYSVRIRALSAAGTGAASAMVVGTTAPAPPTLMVASGVVGDSTKLSVAFTAPSGNGSITGYEFSIDQGITWRTATGTTSPIQLTGMSANTNDDEIIIHATNAGGDGDDSISFGGTTVPGAMTGLSVTGYNVEQTYVRVFFTAPTGGNALPITAYESSLDGGATWVPALNVLSPIYVTDLAANTTYSQIRVRAVTTAGAGDMNPSNLAGTSVPGVPSAVTVAQYAGDVTKLTIGYVAPTGGPATLTYSASVDGGSSYPFQGLTSNPLVLTGLLSNHTYTDVQIRAENAAGYGAATSDLPGTTQAGPPTIAAITAPSPASLSVAFIAPAGDATSGYQYSTDAGATWRDRTDGGTLASPLIIGQTSATGAALAANGVHSVQLRALNAGGTGLASASTTGTTLAGPPTSMAVSPVAANGSELVAAFTAPVGAATITGYQFSIDAGAHWTTAAGQASPIALTGLTGNTAYTQLRVRAVNAGGPGAASTDTAGTTVASAPSITAITGTSSTTLSVTFSAPAGGSANPITNYQFSTDGGTSWSTASPAVTTSPLVISGLTTGQIYPVRLRAVTTAGAGSSSPALSGTALAGGAVITAIGAGAQQELSVAFDSVVGATDYQYSTDGGATWKARSDGGTTGSPLVIDQTSPAGSTALDTNTTYAVTLRAVVGATAGDSGAPFEQTTLPAAPSSVIASGVPGDSTRLSLTYTVAGPAGLINVEYSLNGGTTWTTAADAAGPVVVTGLDSNTTYAALRLRASNAGGTGDASATVSGTTVSAAATDTVVTPTSGTSLHVAFTAPAPSTGITGYQYSTDDGTTWKTRTSGTTTSPVAITETSVAGTAALTPGTAYDIRLRALTAAGAGEPTSTMTASTLADAPQVVRQASATTSSLAISSERPGTSSGVVDVEYSTDDGVSWATRAACSCSLDATAISTTSESGGTAPLVQNSNYPVRLRYVTIGGGIGEASPTLTATTKMVAPTVVQIIGHAPHLAHMVATFTQDPGGSATVAAYEYSLDGGVNWLNTPGNTFPPGGTYAQHIENNPAGGLLLPNTEYDMMLRGINAAGRGDATTPVRSATPPSIPNGVVVSGATASSMDVSFDSGGATIGATTAFDYSTDGGATWTTHSGTSTSFTIAGLTAATGYRVAVRGRNIGGPSLASATVITATATTAPTTLKATTASSSAKLTWVAPVAPVAPATGSITDFAIELSNNGGASWTTFSHAASSATAATVTGLTPGTSYLFRVSAVNIGGSSAVSTNSTAVTPFTLPAAPVIVSVTPGNGQAAVVWSLATDGYSGTIFRATSSNAKTCAVGLGTTTCTVTGLTNGTSYTFTVTATNSAGSVTSAISAAVTPVNSPGAPTSVTGTAGNGQVGLAWVAPASSGGSAITSYTAVASPDGASCTSTSGAPITTGCTITGLTNGTAYRFTVFATNSIGAGNQSALSAAVTPRTTPGTPAIGLAVAGNTSVTVTWAAPTSNGGAAITAYTARAAQDTSKTCTTALTSCTVTGLTNGTPYTFTVTATNAAGAGSVSAASNAATPAAVAVPGPPTGAVATAATGSAILNWSAPVSNGGAAITQYTVTASPGGGGCSVATGVPIATTCTVTGLSNGVTYTFTATATNSAGTGLASAASAPMTLNSPTAPTGLTADRSAVSVGGSIVVTLTGTNVGADTSVASNDAATATVDAISFAGGHLTFSLHGVQQGTTTLRITNPDGGYGSLAVTTTTALAAAAPVAPLQIAKGSTMTFTIRADGLQAGATLGNGTGLTTTNVSATTNGTMIATITATAAAATSDLTITNPDGNTTLLSLPVVAPPTIGSMTPSQVTAGAVSVPLTLNGTGFVPGPAVTVTGGVSGTVRVEATQYLSSTRMIVQVTVTADASTGGWTLTMNNRDGGVTSATLTVLDLVTVSAVFETGTDAMPIAETQQGATIDLTIIGSGFRPGSAVLFSGTGLSVSQVTVVDGHTMTLQLTVSASAPATSRNVTVINPDATTGTLQQAFVIRSSV